MSKTTAMHVTDGNNPHQELSLKLAKVVYETLGPDTPFILMADTQNEDDNGKEMVSIVMTDSPKQAINMTEGFLSAMNDSFDDIVNQAKQFRDKRESEFH